MGVAEAQVWLKSYETNSRPPVEVSVAKLTSTGGGEQKTSIPAIKS